MVVRMKLYDGLYKCVCSGVPRQGFAFHVGVVDYHRGTSSIK